MVAKTIKRGGHIYRFHKKYNSSEKANQAAENLRSGLTTVQRKKLGYKYGYKKGKYHVICVDHVHDTCVYIRRK